MKIAVIENNDSRIESVINTLQHYFYLNYDKPEIFSYSNFKAFIDNFEIEEFSFLFIDYDLLPPDNIIRQVIEEDPNLMIIIGYDSPIEASDKNNVIYMQKPYSLKNLISILDKALSEYYLYTRKVLIEVGKFKYEVHLNDIVYAKIENHSTVLHLTNNKCLSIRMTFGRFLDLIKFDPRFMICTRSLTINMDKIKEISDDCVYFKDGLKLNLKKPLQIRPLKQWDEYQKNRA